MDRLISQKYCDKTMYNKKRKYSFPNDHSGKFIFSYWILVQMKIFLPIYLLHMPFILIIMKPKADFILPTTLLVMTSSTQQSNCILTWN